MLTHCPYNSMEGNGQDKSRGYNKCLLFRKENSIVTATSYYIHQTQYLLKSLT